MANDYSGVSDHALAVALEEHENAVTAIRAELFRRLKDNGATKLPDSEFEIALKPGEIINDDDVLRPLLEDERVGDEAAKAFFAGHYEQKWVPDKWDNQRLNALKKFGADIAKRIEKGQLRGQEKLIVKRRK